MHYRYPKSFPTSEEQRFLDVLFSPRESFITHYHQWITTCDFDATPIAISRLLPLVYHRFNQIPHASELDHDPVTRKIKGIYKLAWYKNQLLIQSLVHVLTILDRAHISCVLLKGTASLAEAYLVSQTATPPLGARFQNDIDILIPKESVRTLIKLFTEDGWYFTDPHFAIQERFSDEQLFASTKEVTFSKQGFTDIDFHWHVTSSSHEPAFTQSIWDHAQRIPVSRNGHSFHTVSIPSPEDRIIHSMIHGAYHNETRPFRWIPDVLLIIDHYRNTGHPINWNTICATAVATGFETEIYFAIHYLVAHHRSYVPASVLTLVETLPLTRKKLRAYFSKTDTVVVPLLGNFPKLWNDYWNRTPRESLLEYFRKKWNLPNQWSLLPFILKKYYHRFINALHRFGLFLRISSH